MTNKKPKTNLFENKKKQKTVKNPKKTKNSKKRKVTVYMLFPQFVEAILVSFGYYFIKTIEMGGTIGAVRLYPPSITNFRVKGLNSGILVQRRV